ncbi:hypothetical protein LCGC14_1306100 [marine sediment metagenome]|uniref:Uncharacterized protein n=1 Tax=marine sediment metagenome TaxID=412755 RepID=A0A0F9N505_9ZZZZ
MMAIDLKTSYSTENGELYAVVCGYELLSHDISNNTNSYELIGMFLSFNDAAHITRTLREHGERDMAYIMIPNSLFIHIADRGCELRHDTLKHQPVPNRDSPVTPEELQKELDNPAQPEKFS